MLVNWSINIALLRSLRLVKRGRVLNQRSSTLAVIALALIAPSFIVALENRLRKVLASDTRCYAKAGLQFLS